MKICECCKKESEKVETLTLCSECFDKLTINTTLLIAENTFLKLIINNCCLKCKFRGERDETARE